MARDISIFLISKYSVNLQIHLYKLKAIVLLVKLISDGADFEKVKAQWNVAVTDEGAKPTGAVEEYGLCLFMSSWIR